MMTSFKIVEEFNKLSCDDLSKTVSPVRSVKIFSKTLKEQRPRCANCNSHICQCVIDISNLREFCEDFIKRYGQDILCQEIKSMRPFTSRPARDYLQRYTLDIPYISHPEKCMHTTWVNLDLLMKQVSSLRKGEKHRMIKDLIPFIEKSWSKTLKYNSNKRALQFIRQCKDLHITINVKFDRDEKFYQVQMYAINAVLRLPTTLNNLQDASDSLFAGISHLGVSLDGFSNNFDQFNILLHKLIDKFSSTVELTDTVMAVFKMVAMLYLMYKAPADANVLYYTGILALAIPSNVVGKISHVFVESLIRAVQTVKDYFIPQNVAQIDSNASVITSFFELTKWVFFGLFKPINYESYKDLSIGSNKVKIVSDYLKNTSTIFEYTLSMCKWCVDFISSSIIQYYGYLPTMFKDDSITLIINEYQDLLNKKIFEKCLLDSSAAKIVLDFNAKTVKLEAECYKAINTQTLPIFKFKILPYIRFINMTVQKVINEIPPHIKDGFEGFRKKPYWVYLHGESNVGKSGSIQPILANALAAKLKLVDNFDDPHNYSFYRVCGREFFGNYKKQPIIQYNDLFQDYANATAMNEAIIELTNIIDEAPYELNMPDVESKGKVFCTSPIVISNAQSDFLGHGFIADRCWSGGVHLYRRRNVVIAPYVYPRYKSRDTAKPGVDWDVAANALAQGVRPCKYLDTIPFDLYNIKFTDPITGIIIRQCDLETAIDVILDDADKYFNKQNTFHDNLMRNMQKTFLGFTQTDNFEDTQTPDTFLPECGCVSAWIEFLRDSPLYIDNNDFREMLNLRLRLAHNQLGLCGKNFGMEVEETQDSERMNSILTHILLGAYFEAFNSVKTPNFALVRAININYMLQIITKVKEKILSVFNWKLLLGIGAIFGTVVTIARMMPAPSFMVQTDEGNRNVRKAKIVRRRIKAQAHETMVVHAQYDNTNRVVEEVLLNNFCTFVLKKKQDNEYIKVDNYTHSLCLGGSVFIIPRHFWRIMQEIKSIYMKNNIETNLFLQWHGGVEIVIPWQHIDTYTPDQEYMVDVLFLRIRKLAPRRMVTHFFLTIDDPSESHEAYLYGLRPKNIGFGEPSVISVDGVRCVSVDYIDTGHQIESFGKTTEFVVKSPMTYEYFNCKTVGGDCGSVLIFVNPRLNSRVIAGMHVGGNHLLNTGFAAPVFREDLDEVFEYFNRTSQEIVIQSDLQYSVCQTDNTSPMYEAIATTGVMIIGKTTTYNNKRIKCVIPRKSNISRSLCFEELQHMLGPNISQPAMLRPFTRNGELVSPFVLAYGKMSNLSPIIDIKLLENVRIHVHNSIMRWNSIFVTDNYPREILDYDRALNGIPGLKQLDLSTSPGFPYVFSHAGVGKRPWFDKFDSVVGPKIKMKQDLQDIVEKRIKMAKDNIIMETYYIDTLKDETRPIDKVRDGKTRLFQVGPMDLTIAMRMYFGVFIAHLHTTYTHGECGPGINCLSTEWDTLVRRMKKFSKHKCGDHKEFDYNTGYQLALEFAEQANLFYDDGVENARIRLTLVSTCVGLYHIVDTMVIFCQQGNNSGNTATTDINDNTNMYINRMAYYEEFGTLMNYDKYTVNIYYGDDSWNSVHDDIIDRFNMTTLSKYFKKYGFIYTSADKGEVKPYISLSEVTYLKRRVVWREDLGLYVGQLPKSIIEEIPRWSESDPHIMSDQLNRFNSSLIEASQYDREYYNKLYKVYVKCIQRLQQYRFDINANDMLEYDYIMKRCYPEHYVYLKDYAGGNTLMLNAHFSDGVRYSEVRTVD